MSVFFIIIIWLEIHLNCFLPKHCFTNLPFNKTLSMNDFSDEKKKKLTPQETEISQ